MSSDVINVCVSIIMPVYNAAEWIRPAIDSILQQTFTNSLEVSIYNDASNDGTINIIEEFRPHMLSRDIAVTITSHEGQPRGVGYAKNRAIEASHGEFLCFLDADDAMLPDRIQCQWDTCIQQQFEHVLVGCKFQRIPEDSTARYTRWANSLTEKQLNTQIYTSNGPTIIMPTWFCRRTTFQLVPGGFSEAGKGTPEDLMYFHAFLRAGGRICRVDRSLLHYRYHPQATTWAILESTIWEMQLAALERDKLSNWPHFSIWNAGKQGRRFYRSLSSASRDKVLSFGDVDERKLQLGWYTWEESHDRPKPRVPIRHFSQLVPPIVICMKQDLTNGFFEKNLQSLNLEEDEEYVWFG